MEHNLQVFTGYFFLLGSLILGVFLYKKHRGVTVIAGLCFLCFLMGFALINHDLIGEFNFFGNSMKLRETVKQAQFDAKTIADLKTSVEAQGKTVELAAKSAADASKLTEEVTKKNEQMNTQLTELDKLFAEAKAKQKDIEELTTISALIVTAQNDGRPALDGLRTLSENKSYRYAALAQYAIANLKTQYLSSPPGYLLIPWEEGVEPEKFNIEQFRVKYKAVSPLFHAHIVNLIYKSNIISKKDKMQFFADILKDDLSIKATFYAGEFFANLSQDKELKWKPYWTEPLLEWWTKNKDKIQ